VQNLFWDSGNAGRCECPNEKYAQKYTKITKSYFTFVA